MIPNFKVTIAHAGESTDYYNRVFSNLNVKRRENNYDVATLVCGDKNQYYYTFKMAKFDEIKIYFKDVSQSSYTQVFGGTIRQANPTLGANGKHLVLNCKGYGAALEDTHCNRDYGIESSNPTYPQPWNIWKNLVADFTNKSFADAATGYALVNTYITDTFGTDIKYVNNPYRTNLEVIDTICNLSCAIGAGTTAGAHWIVDPSKRLLIAKIGDHAAGATSPENYWSDWYNYLEADSTLTEGVDFTEYALLDKAEEYANNIILLTDIRRPCYDYWTEGNTTQINALWTDVLAVLTAEAAVYVVGATSLKIAPTEADAPGYAYLPTALNIEKVGSAKTIPCLNFYCYKPAGLDETNTTVRLYTTDYANDYFEATFATINTMSGGDPDDTWIHKSIPIGPYYASAETSQKYRWTKVGNADWANIQGVCFRVAALTYLLIDDLHINGKIIRSAKDTSEISRVNEYQKVLITRNSMDDSCVDSDDSGFAGRIAYAELLRRTNLPITPTFTLKKGRPQMMAGQKVKVQLCKRSDGTFAVDTTMRMLTVEHNFVTGTGLTTTVTATTDLKNSFPISVPDAYAMWQENMFVNSSEAKNIRAGAEVDLLIPILSKSY